MTTTTYMCEQHHVDQVDIGREASRRRLLAGPDVAYHRVRQARIEEEMVREALIDCDEVIFRASGKINVLPLAIAYDRRRSPAIP